MLHPCPTRRPVLARLAPALAVLVLTLTLVLVFTGLMAESASAESPTRVAEDLDDDGVFVGFGRTDVDEVELAAAVADARRRGLDLVVVAPRDPQPTAKAFARRIQEQTEADAAVVLPEDGLLEAYVNDEMEQATARPRAIDAARGLDDPAAAVAAFSEELLALDSGDRPRVVNQILQALLLFALLIGAAVVVERILSRAADPAPTA